MTDWQDRVAAKRAQDFDVRPEARPWYDRLDTATAIQIAKERIEEWSYDEDAHGYCHERSVLVALIAAIEDDGASHAT